MSTSQEARLSSSVPKDDLSEDTFEDLSPHVNEAVRRKIAL